MAVTRLRPDVTPGPVWLSPAQVCERVPGLTLERLAYLRDRSKGPMYFKPTEKTVVYEAAAVDAWVRSTAVVTRDAS
ncbi:MULTISPECIES: hypothetical protein [unclassified Microbacterium]|uniref:hypothetical protein n=1 Tax=Microbacterium TaxID=33882 RepID=UPI003BA029A3